MAKINGLPSAVSLNTTYKAIEKYVRQYIESGALKTRFDFFESDEITNGIGFEINLILGATGSTQKQDEHGKYNPKVMTVVSNTNEKWQYAVTIDEAEVEKCTGNEEKVQEYAMKLTESLYQGWIDKKNVLVSGAIERLLSRAPTASYAVEQNTGETARNLLVAIKSKVNDFLEGVTGNSYNNTIIGNDRIASERIAVLVSNTTKAMLDVHGYGTTFNKEYADIPVEIIATNRLDDGVALVTDARNIQVHKWRENIKRIENSDFSYNIFHNVLYRIDAMQDSTTFVSAFPCVKVTGVEAQAQAQRA